MYAGDAVDLRPQVSAMLHLHPTVAWLYDDLAVSYMSNPPDCPTFEHHLLSRIAASAVECQRISYRSIEYEPVSLLLRHASDNRRRLLIYNHGHDGLPSDKETFAVDLLTRWFREGNDILLSSMPFTGLNEQTSGLRFDSWEGPGVMSPANFPSHSLFELVNTGHSHYIRMFIDDVVLPVLFHAEMYEETHYVGFSGGATVGLHSCLALASLLDSCTLIAGVMPAQLRGLPLALGDAEQFSSGLLRQFKVTDALRGLSLSPVYTRLMFNAHDPCCFDEISSSALVNHLSHQGVSLDVIIEDSDRHSFNPDRVRRGLDMRRNAKSR
jgi:hypothetical protein